MTKHSNKLAGWATALLTLTAATYADVKLNDNITFSGYAVGAYMNYKADGSTSVDSLFDASKPIPGGGDSNDVLTKFTLNFKPVTGVISLNYFPNVGGNSEFTVLDAYANQDVAAKSAEGRWGERHCPWRVEFPAAREPLQAHSVRGELVDEPIA